MRTINYTAGKKRVELVCGLIWHPLQQSKSARPAEIQTFAKANGDDLKVVREGDSPHVGLAKKIEGAKAGQISLAALIADAMAEEKKTSCLIAIALPEDANSFVFVAIRDGVILADSDFIGTRDEIKVRLTSDMSYGGWDSVICPDEWAVINATERSLDSFFTPDTIKEIRRWKLTEASIAWRKAAVLLGIVVIIGVASVYGWKQWQHKKYLAAEALRIQQEEVEMGLKSATTEPAKPWPLLPTALDFATACDRAYQRINTTAGNWQLDRVACENQSLNLRWVKSTNGAWPSHLAAARPDITIAPDGLTATLSFPLQVEPANDFTLPLPSGANMQLSYLDAAARMGVALVIQPAKAPAPPPQLPGQQAPPQQASLASWVEFTISVESAIGPVEVVRALDHPGFRLTSIEYVTKSGVPNYKLLGVQYASN